MKLHRFGRGLLAVCLASAVFCGVTLQCGVVDAQYTLTLAGGAGLDAATASVLFDNAGDDLRGWSFGVCSDPVDLSLVAAASGSTTATVNQGGAPDFESLDLFADGVTHAVVVCFTSCDVLAPGSGYELLTIDYDLLASPGLYPISFCDTLGTPTVDTLVVDTTSTGITPTQVNGTVEKLEPVDPIVALSCTQSSDPCVCEFDLSWTNQGPYDSINVYEDGTLIDTLPGTATATTIAVPGSATYCLEPIRDGIVGDQTCCLADCAPGDVFPDPVVIDSCLVDQASCTATVDWTNTSSYASLSVKVDGTEVMVLTGADEQAIIALGGPGLYEICIDGVTICGDAVPAACCTVECLTDFARADANGDGLVNIADAIAQLDLFVGVDNVVDCVDALDTNDDGNADIADPVFLLNYLFTLGPAPGAPFLTCGTDPTADSIGCNAFDACP